jgi:hypothetical protein
MRTCKFCNKDLLNKDYRQIFCNRSCAASYNNKITKTKTRLINNCVVCKTILINQKKYCSLQCNLEAKWNATIQKIENGKETSTNSLKKYLYSFRPHKCEICMGEEWMGNKMPLVMDHINGNSTDNRLSNLRLICPNCDRFTPTFGIKNKGNGRQSRGVKRYDKYDKSDS